MASYNRIVLVGNLTRDPDYKQLNSGQSLCRLGLATNRQFKSRQTGTMIQEVCYVDIEVWGPQAESCRQYLQKGRPILVEGRLKFDTWEDQNGGGVRSKHSIVADRVVFLGSAGATMDNEVNNFSQGSTNTENELKAEFKKVEEKEASIAKTKAATKKKTSTKKNTEDIPEIQIDGLEGFKDEAPFEDDLPF